MSEYPIYNYRIVQGGQSYVVKADGTGFSRITGDPSGPATLWLGNQLVAALSGEYMIVRIEEENQE